ncbi:MAG TPA: asparagine synthase C-terminal domain-containing protein [Kofleriaceae bacterium]|nr:asparagine synthase C-terminal domain-containing protein [Kofleriaceae bacterium]
MLLSGVLAEPATAELAARIRAALVDGRYEELGQIAGELVGCLVTSTKVCLFKTIMGNSSTIFFRRSRGAVRWSTDPAEVVEDPDTDIDRAAISRCCRGEGPFIYPSIDRVRPGQVVVLEQHRTTVVEYDRITPMALPRRITLPEYAEIAYELLLDAVRPYAGSGRVGVLLSGGIDSSSVLTALVDAGADVIAYHLDTEDQLADESVYARAVCEHLDVPLVSILTDNSAGYLSRSWDFPHPYSHTGYRHLEQAAERVAEDGVTFLATGREGDILFGPAYYHYGMHDLLFGDVPWSEKKAMLYGVLSSRWQLSTILKSCFSNASLVEGSMPIGENARRSDFLVPMLGLSHEKVDYDFMAQESTMDLTLFRPRGVLLCSPMGSKDLRRLSMRLPNAYRWIPFQGRLIDKPVLRMMLARRLPDLIWRRGGRSWLNSPPQSYVLRHSQPLRELIGSPGSHLVRTGIVNPGQLAKTLGQPLSVRRNAEALICSAMVELFLRSMENRLGTAWKGSQDASTFAS